MSINIEQESNHLSETKHKVLPSISRDVHKKLQLLAVVCDINKTQLAGGIIEFAVNSPEIINWFQDKYKVKQKERIVPFIDSDGKTIYKRNI
ncbi:hypothetical protein [Paenibacillus sp. Soil750]|uniref:hypothetical protein n=1 Tax=Paenibacillus sp. Soil750 TaxID=1736398 RepID=UPI0006F2A4F9|nr:hypothetical protein [Paenibacillus sp. Soil750]KRE69726.1 hypothetical protein ASL11_15270 [Paenibacillus sp. Soil750]